MRSPRPLTSSVIRLNADDRASRITATARTAVEAAEESRVAGPVRSHGPLDAAASRRRSSQTRLKTSCMRSSSPAPTFETGSSRETRWRSETWRLSARPRSFGSARTSATRSSTSPCPIPSKHESSRWRASTWLSIGATSVATRRSSYCPAGSNTMLPNSRTDASTSGGVSFAAPMATTCEQIRPYNLAVHRTGARVARLPAGDRAR
jgi:hypothetical protein